MSVVTGPSPSGAVRGAELAIGGMTCASCAARIEKKLNRLDGVTAAVNLATETAHVTFPAAVRTEDLIAAVERTGYTAALAVPPEAGTPAEHDGAEAAGRAPAAAGVAGPGRPGGGPGHGPGAAVPVLAVGRRWRWRRRS